MVHDHKIILTSQCTWIMPSTHNRVETMIHIVRGSYPLLYNRVEAIFIYGRGNNDNGVEGMIHIVMCILH